MATKKKTVTPNALNEVIAVEDNGEKLDLTKTTNGQVKLDDNALINVKSNVFGELTYIDRRTQEKTKWERCGSMQQLTLGALRSMKASSIAFYKNQWVIITGFADENSEKYTTADIYKALAITQYYKDLIEPSDYEAICSWNPEMIEQRVSMMSAEAKANLAVALNAYIEREILDSIKRIRAFESALGCELKMPE